MGEYLCGGHCLNVTELGHRREAITQGVVTFYTPSTPSREKRTR